MKIKEILAYSDRKIHPATKDHCELCGFKPHRGLFVRWAQNDNRELCIWCVRLNNKAHSLIINKKSEREDFYKKYGKDGHPLKVCPASYWDPVKEYQSEEPYSERNKWKKHLKEMQKIREIIIECTTYCRST